MSQYNLLINFPLELLHECDQSYCLGGGRGLDGMKFQLMPSLQDGGMCLLDGYAQFAAKSSEDISLPRIVLGINLRLYLFVVDDCYAYIMM